MFSIEDSLRSARLHSLLSDKKAHPFDELVLSTSPRRGQSVSPRRQGASSSPVSVLSAPSPLPVLTPKRRRMVDDELNRFDEAEAGPLKRHQPSAFRAEFSSPSLDLPDSDSDTDLDMDSLSDSEAVHLKRPSLPILRPSSARVRARATALSAADLEAVESLMGIKHASPAPPSPPQLAARVWPASDPIPAVAVAVALPVTARPVPVPARAVEASAFSLLPPAAVAALPVASTPLRATPITRAEAVSVCPEPARVVPTSAVAAARPVQAVPVAATQPVPAIAVALPAAVPALPLPMASTPATVTNPGPVPALPVPAVVRAKPLPLPVVSARVVSAATCVPSRVISVASDSVTVPAQVLRREDRVSARVVGRVVTPGELLQVLPSAPAPTPALIH